IGRHDAEQQENDRQAATGRGDLRHQDDLAAAFDRLRSLLDLGFKAGDLVARVGCGLLARWPMPVGAVCLLWHCGPVCDYGGAAQLLDYFVPQRDTSWRFAGRNRSLYQGADCLTRHARACRGHPRLTLPVLSKAWMAGTSPAMTRRVCRSFRQLVLLWVAINRNLIPARTYASE